MSRFLANENVPRAAIDAVRQAGHDITWVHDQIPGADDEHVLQLALHESRVLVTFDQDFGEMVFRENRAAFGVILLRPRMSSPQHVVQFILNVLGLDLDWESHYCVAQEGRVRLVPLAR